MINLELVETANHYFKHAVIAYVRFRTVSSFFFRRGYQYPTFKEAIYDFLLIDTDHVLANRLLSHILCPSLRDGEGWDILANILGQSKVCARLFFFFLSFICLIIIIIIRLICFLTSTFCSIAVLFELWLFRRHPTSLQSQCYHPFSEDTTRRSAWLRIRYP